MWGWGGRDSHILIEEGCLSEILKMNHWKLIISTPKSYQLLKNRHPISDHMTFIKILTHERINLQRVASHGLKWTQ